MSVVLRMLGPGVSWIAALAVVAVLAIPARAEPYRDEARHWSVTPPPGWRTATADMVATIDQEFAARMPQKQFTYIAAFIKGDIAKDQAGVMLSYPYLLVQITPVPLAGKSFRQIAEAFDAQLMTDATQKAAAAVKDAMTLGPPGAARIDPAHNRMVFDVTGTVLGIGTIKGRCMGFFGKDCIVQLNFYAKADEFEAQLPDFEAFVAGFAYDPGYAFVATPDAASPAGPGTMKRALVYAGAGAVVAGVIAVLIAIAKRRTKEKAGSAPPGA